MSTPSTRTLSEWLQLMLAEIAAKREARERERAEEALRESERGASAQASVRGGAASPR
ncbi:MAG TPA: hypothetical protein VEU54_12420 [Steroidobacteraceae bacterium]|jgi:hypothetical protein|nr:hypothetical protein [Steroidobacteraceae bacterium]